jgi:acyl-CoA synthetase (AMP-forming)/AMP-acid ligase II
VAGFKISPLPIEDALREALGVSGVCLFSMPDQTSVEQLHVILEGEPQVAGAGLAEALSREVAGFHKAYVHRTAALPRNPNGKLLRPEARQAALAPLGESASAGVLEVELTYTRPSLKALVRPGRSTPTA